MVKLIPGLFILALVCSDQAFAIDNSPGSTLTTGAQEVKPEFPATAGTGAKVNETSAPPATVAPPAVEQPAPIVSPETSAPGALPLAPATTITPTVVAPEQPVEKVKENPPEPKLVLDSEEQKRAYASGVALAHYIEGQLSEQKQLHVTLDKDILISGMMDTFHHKGQMTDSDVHTTLAVFDEQLKILTAAENDKRLVTNNAYVDEFSQHDGVKKSLKGFYYLILDRGEGKNISDSTMVTVHYKGTLIDGSVVDGAQEQNANQVFRVENLMPALRDTIKVIHKGGKLQVVIPAYLVPGTVRLAHPVPQNSALVYTMEVIEVN